VLAGILGALLATGLDAPVSAAVAAHVHGRAGQLAAADGPLIAGDLVRRLPATLARVRGAGRVGAAAPGTLGT
jgi:NAD(P)H-hydrate repair Nnr-like enzyme with NAD(P)H-hydrate dehydratase domain